MFLLSSPRLKPWLLFLVTLSLSWCCWWGNANSASAVTGDDLMGQQFPPGQLAQSLPTDTIRESLGTPIPKNPNSVDPIPTRYYPGFESYIENCSSCHLALPPEVLPIEAWQQILQNPNDHYGVSLDNLNRLTQLLIWDYVSTFSRPLPPNTPVPVYTEKSRYFKALHPKVQLPTETTTKTCLTCHPKGLEFDFITLSPEWEATP